MSDPQPWSAPHRLSALALSLDVAGALLVALVPTTIGIVRGSGSWTVPWFLIGGALLVVAATYLIDAVRIRRTRLSIDGEWVTYEFTLIGRKHVSLPRGRVRTVEVVADPVQRVLGIATLRMGSGEKNGQITMRSLARPVAEDLRVKLLDRGLRDEATDDQRVGEIARWQPRWIWFAPVSAASVLLAGAAFGVPLQVAEWFNAAPQVWRELTSPVRGGGLILGIAAIAVVALLIGGIAAIVFQAEAWWNYRLERQSDGTLRVERGLLFHRSTVFEGSRIRGAVLVERLGARMMSGARIELIALGMRSAQENQQSESSTVLPEAPRDVALRVFEILTGEAPPEHLAAHPIAARAKRVRWAVASTAALVLAAVVVVLTTGVGWWLPVLMLAVVGSVSVGLAFAAYDALGHTMTGSHVYIRYGAVRRATHALRRDAIVSWNVRQSFFQQRNGLSTVGATTAADQAIVKAPDVGPDQAVAALLESDPRIWRPLVSAESSH